jgi:3'(2'), 5'-bisphosphate nucleotidase
MGVVYAPSVDELYFAVQGHGAYVIKNGADQNPDSQLITRIHAHEFTDPSLVTNLASRSHYDPRVEEIMKKLNATIQIKIGSFGIKVNIFHILLNPKAAYIASGRGDTYINPSGKTSFWDTCGPEAILLESGAALVNQNLKPIVSQILSNL